MKKTIITISLAIFSLAAFSQAPPPPKKEITITATPEVWDIIFKGLYKLPAEESMNIILGLNNQIQKQVNAQLPLPIDSTSAKQPKPQPKKEEPKKN